VVKKKVNEEVLRKLKHQIKREQPAEKRDTIRVDPELDEAIDAYIDEIKRGEPGSKIDRGTIWRTAVREYLGLTPKATAGQRSADDPHYIPIEDLMPA
jgi:hypothetical protein